MDILDRYIFRKFLAVFTTTLVLLFGLGTIVKILDSLRDFEQNKHGTMLLVKYYATVMPAYVPYIVPPSLVFAIAFTISHFNRNFEISVILAAGRSFRRILRPMLIFAIILACAFFLFNQYVAYPAARRATDISYLLRNKAPDERLRKYDKSNDMTLHFGQRYYTIGHGAWYNRELHGFHLLELGPQGNAMRMVEAEKAIAENLRSHRWKLLNARITRFTPEGTYLQTEIYAEHELELPENLHAIQNFYVDLDMEERSIFDSYRFYRKRRELGGSYEGFLTEVFWHAGYPLVCVFIVFIGGIIGGRLRRSGLAVSISVAMLVTLVYYALMYFGTAFGETGMLPPAIAGNLANMVATACSLWLHWQYDF